MIAAPPSTTRAAATARIHRALAIAVLALALAGLRACGEETATVAVVKVQKRRGVVGSAKRMEATLKLQKSYAKLFQDVTVPTDFYIRADGLSGTGTLTVTLKDAQERRLAAGTGQISIVPDTETVSTVTLLPADFQVNALPQSEQFFSTSVRGRQLASDGAGNFAVIWEDSCPQAGRCDVWLRLYDADAQPRLNALGGTTQEHQASAANDTYDHPAVAMKADGHMVAAWKRISAAGVFVRAFEKNGRPDSVASSGQEIKVSSGSGDTPDIAVLADNSHVVVWSETASGSDRIMARYLGPNGRPTKAHNGKNEPLQVTSFSASTSKRPLPAVAGNTNSANPGYMVVWVQNGVLWGRAHRARGQPVGAAFRVSGAGTVASANIEAMNRPDRYAVVWSATGECGPDKTGSCIRFRVYDAAGAPVGPAWTVNTDHPGDQTEPAVARLPGNDDMLVVWSSNQAPGDEGGGIRGRKVLSMGLAVGPEFGVNSTTRNKQSAPSIAAHRPADRSFIVVWEDNSGIGPDPDKSIRGRIIYPDFQQATGDLGSLCEGGAPPCKPAYHCVQTPMGKRCLDKCDSGKSCPGGGQCKTLSGSPPREVCFPSNV